MSYSVKIDGIEYDVLAECGDYDYSWHIGAVLRKSGDGVQLYWLEDSGCSCNTYADFSAYEDLTPISHWTEAVQVARDSKSWGDTPSFSDEQVADFAAILMKVEWS